MPVYDQVKQALQDILAPELQGIKGELRRLDERISAVEAKIEGTKHELLAEIKRLEEKTEARFREMDARFKEMETRITALEEKFETKFSALDEKLETRFRELDSKFEGLRHEVRTALEIRERLAALEAKVGITRP